MQALLTALSSLWDWLSLGGSEFVLTSCAHPTQPLLAEFESEFETFSFTEIQSWTGPQEVIYSYLLVQRQNYIYPHPILGQCLSDLLF